MGRRLYPLLLAAILAAGCGGDEGGGSDGGGATPSPPASRAWTPPRDLEGRQGGAEDLCEEAGNADEAKAREASQKVCSRIVEETIPAGPARDAGVQACKQTNQ